MPPLRPIEGPEQDGFDAFFQGSKRDDCPFSTGSHHSLLWEAGWLEGSIVDEDTCPVYADDMRGAARCLRSEARDLRFAIEDLLPTTDDAGAAIGVPTTEWPMRCFEIASKIAESGILQPVADAHGAIRVMYGAYHGKISSSSPFARRPFARHGWLELESGPVIDPTRWVFLAEAPKISVVGVEDYDFGAVAMRLLRRPGAPACDASRARPFACSRLVGQVIDRALQGKGEIVSRGRIDPAQAAWLGACAPQTFGSIAREVYTALDANDFQSCVPIDLRGYMFGEPAVTPSPTLALAR